MKLLHCSVLLRLFILVLTASTWSLGILTGRSLVYELAHTTNWLAWASVWLMLPLAVLGLADVFINDILPDSWISHRALRDRHLVHIGIALCFAVQTYIAADHGYPLTLMLYDTIFIVFITLSAVSDIKHRFERAPLINNSDRWC
jgi:uncharacterized protein (DUF58 family)